jgi:hypothetical protein
MIFSNITSGNSQAVQNNETQVSRAVVHFVQCTCISVTVIPCSHSTSRTTINSKYVETQFRSFHGNVWQSPVDGWLRRVGEQQYRQLPPLVTKVRGVFPYIFSTQKVFSVTLDPRSGHVGYVVDQMVLWQLFYEYFGFPCQFSFHKLFHIH